MRPFLWQCISSEQTNFWHFHYNKKCLRGQFSRSCPSTCVQYTDDLHSVVLTRWGCNISPCGSSTGVRWESHTTWGAFMNEVISTTFSLYITIKLQLELTRSASRHWVMVVLAYDPNTERACMFCARYRICVKSLRMGYFALIYWHAQVPLQIKISAFNQNYSTTWRCHKQRGSSHVRQTQTTCVHVTDCIP